MLVTSRLVIELPKRVDKADDKFAVWLISTRLRVAPRLTVYQP